MHNFKNAEIIYIPVKSIEEPSYNNIDYVVLEEYVNRLKDNPRRDLQPIIVRRKGRDKYIIHDGRHRTIAYTHAERDEIPVIVIAL